MKTIGIEPEGWNNEITELKTEDIDEYLQTKGTLQGLVRKCDEQYNLHINFKSGIEGIIPREEIEGINIEDNGLPKINLCTGKVHKFVQFKIKEKLDKVFVNK